MTDEVDHTGEAREADEVRETQHVLELAMRVGELMLSAGAGAADVHATMERVAKHLGVRDPDLDVTFTSMRMTAPRAGRDNVPVDVNRSIRRRTIDYSHLSRIDDLVEEILTGNLSREDARRRVEDILRPGHWVPDWAVVAGAGVQGAGMSLVFGGGWLVAGMAYVAGVGISLLTGSLGRMRWPLFYQQFAGGLFATAVGVAGSYADRDTSVVITSSIVLLLSGIGFMGAISDAMSGFYVTAVARILEAVLATAGLLAGVSAGLAFASLVGVELGYVQRGDTGFADVPIMLLGATLAATAFAVTRYVPLRAVPIIMVAALVAYAVYSAVNLPGLSRTWSAGTAALAVGLIGHGISRRVHEPALVIVTPALMPMLPGLAVYRALGYIGEGNSSGFLEMATAVATTIALAAGVILADLVVGMVRGTPRMAATAWRRGRRQQPVRRS